MLADTIAVGAWHEDELVGFARAVTDGLFRAYWRTSPFAPITAGRGSAPAS